MKLLLAMIAVTLFCFSSNLWAAEQHEKMRGCNVEAKSQSLSGDARKDFMKKCLSSEYKLKPETVEKMKSCGDKARTKKLEGEEHKKFLSSCLSGSK